MHTELRACEISGLIEVRVLDLTLCHSVVDQLRKTGVNESQLDQNNEVFKGRS